MEQTSQYIESLSEEDFKDICQGWCDIVRE